MTIPLPRLPDAFGAVTTHTSCPQQFTPWPHPPYLDTATDVQTVYTITQVYAIQREAMRVALEAAAEVLTEHQIPVGNSAAGELACQWTYDALKECRDAIRALEIAHG